MRPSNIVDYGMENDKETCPRLALHTSTVSGGRIPLAIGHSQLSTLLAI